MVAFRLQFALSSVERFVVRITHLRNPRDNSHEVSILPEGNDTKAQVLARAAQFFGTVMIYEDIFLGKRTLNEVVIGPHGSFD